MKATSITFRDISRTIGYIILGLGVIVSFILAGSLGKGISYGYTYERNWGVTLLIFVVGVVVSFAEAYIFFAIAEIIDNQAIISSNQSGQLEILEKKVDDLQQQNKALSAYVTDITDRVKQENSKNGIPAKEESVSIRKEHEENHKIAIDQIQGKISAAKTAKELYEIFLEAGEKNTVFLNELKRLGDLERIYGTMVNEARKIISEYYK